MRKAMLVGLAAAIASCQPNRPADDATSVSIVTREASSYLVRRLIDPDSDCVVDFVVIGKPDERRHTTNMLRSDPYNRHTVVYVRRGTPIGEEAHRSVNPANGYGVLPKSLGGDMARIRELPDSLAAQYDQTYRLAVGPARCKQF